MKNRHINKAVKIFGNQNRMASEMGVTRQAVHGWLFGKHRISPEKAIELSKKTHGKLTPNQLRPDIYPDANWLPEIPSVS